MKFKSICALVASATLLSACATGVNQRADVFRADSVNQEQELEIVKILMVQPAKVSVSNEQAKKAAQVATGLLGAIGGALLGNNDTARIAGGAVGGVVGGAVGDALIPTETIVEGVSIAYKKEGVKKVLHSAQVGKTCEYKPGNAMMVFTVTQDGKKESRIQPNNPNGCPKDDQKE